MENISRRKFLRLSLGIPLMFSPAFAIDKSKRVHIILPKKPFEYYIKKGKEKGGRILIVGGIHGNEIGAYKAADVLINLEIKKGELIIVPRSNFTSILANQRGYNGDMNRKFSHISPEDKDYPLVENIKQLILTFKPDVVLSLHDGYGFHSLNKNHWGQCIVIDEYQYKAFPLFKIAKYVSLNVNKKIKNIKYKVPVYNTQTFSSTKHLEQRKALTGWCLKNNIPAFCIESSKQILSLKEKVKTHFYILNEFFKIYNIEIKPSFEYVLDNLQKYIEGYNYSLTAKINGKIKTIKYFENIKIPKGSEFKIISFRGSRGVFSVAHDINLNWQDFYIGKNITIYLKDDYKKIFGFNIIVV